MLQTSFNDFLLPPRGKGGALVVHSAVAISMQGKNGGTEIVELA